MNVNASELIKLDVFNKKIHKTRIFVLKEQLEIGKFFKNFATKYSYEGKTQYQNLNLG